MKKKTRPSLEERFWKFVDIKSDDECWEWQGYRNPLGYGEMSQFHLTERTKPARAHRVSYTINVGEIPEGHEVCHTCDNPPCCNPNHLFEGTHYDNMQDAKKKGRMGKRKHQELTLEINNGCSN